MAAKTKEPPQETAVEAAESPAEGPVDVPEPGGLPPVQRVAYRLGEPGLGEETIGLLDLPLDRERVKSREGRGGGTFDYLEVHDVVRTANRIFGYGGWGHQIVEQAEIGSVEVVSRSNKKGWHVGYRCRVRLVVRGCMPVDGSGYGDATEYGPAARVTAQELALKESESDALKRAFKNYGDQFGLILYAKEGDQRRIEQQQAQDQTAQARSDAPVTLDETLARLLHWVEDGSPWVKEAVEALYPGELNGKRSLVDDAEHRFDLLRRFQLVVLTLEAQEGFNASEDLEKTQAVVRAAFSSAFEGLAILGPEPFRPPIPF